MIGMAFIYDDYPLYYEATNEKGLSMAGLHFPQYASYKSFTPGKDNIAPFEFLPWVLAQCASVAEVQNLLSNLNLVHEDFRSELPLTPLHWIISDQTDSLVVESIDDGLQIFPNPIGILTNAPGFEKQMENYNCFKDIILPGDLSSESRFIRAAFVKELSVCGISEAESVNQFFHLLGSVEYQKGRVRAENGSPKFTIYSCCCNTDEGIYYYKTYNNLHPCAIHMHHENLNGTHLSSYALIQSPQFNWQN
jgi:choloylglycine hydrolase